MAVSRVTINHGAINSHFAGRPFSGSGLGARGSAARGEPIQIAERMALQARINAATRYEQRTGSLVSSVRPIVREGRGGEVEVGVGTTVEHGRWLEQGTIPHTITPQRPFTGRKGSGYFLRSNGPNSKGPNPDPLIRPQLRVEHPGNLPGQWLSDAVRTVLPGALVRVRYPIPYRGS